MKATLATALLSGAVGLLSVGLTPGPALSAQSRTDSPTQPRTQPNPQPPAVKPKRLLLAVGSDGAADPHWSPLQFAHKDAADVAAFFAHSAQPIFDHTTVLASPYRDGSATPVTRGAIRQALADLARANTSSEDIVILYVSGHGTVDWRPALARVKGQPKELARYFVTWDTDSRAVAATALPYQELLAAFRNLKSRKKALILDFCHSGTGKSVLTPEMAIDLAGRRGDYFPPLESEEVEGEYVLAASGWQQAAGESARLHNGIYTHFLLEGFARDLNGDGGVSLMEAHSYARAQTAAFTGFRQTPTAQVRLKGADPIWIRQGRDDRDHAQLYDLLHDGLLHDGLKLLINGTQLRSGGAYRVPDGRQRLTLVHARSAKVFWDNTFRFQAGKVYALQDLMTVSPQYSLTLGLGARRYLSGAVRARFAPQIETGPSLRYVHAAVWRLWDLHVAASQMAADEHVAGIRQRRVTDQFVLRLGWRERLGSLFAESSLRMTVYGAVSGGPAFRRVRLLSSRANAARDDSMDGWGVEVGAELGLLLPKLGLTAGLGLSVDAGASPFAGIRGPIMSSGGQFFVGAMW